MDIKKHFGFDFRNKPEEALDYLRDLGAVVVKEEAVVRDSGGHAHSHARYVALEHTPRILEVSTEAIHLGMLDGSIEVITLVTGDAARIDRLERRLHSYAKGNVSVSFRDSAKQVRWQFDNCSIVKATVFLPGRDSAYFRYDILPPGRD